MIRNLQIVGGLAVLLAILALFAAYKGEQRHSAKLQGQIVKLTAELERISSEKNEQRTETVKTIAKADAGNKVAEKTARKIEAAPVKGDCSTPAEIMGADL